MPSRARTGDRADGELPLQDSNLDYLIQSSRVGACLEDTMSASGDLPSIGALTVGEKCPDRSGETLVKCLQRLCSEIPSPSGSGDRGDRKSVVLGKECRSRWSPY